MTEQVTRHRGAVRDENGKLTAATDVTLTAKKVAPGGGSEYAERSRDGENTAFTVFFAPGVDVVNSDELTVREQRCTVVVNDWRGSGRGGLEVLCARSQG